jgi:dynein heavy chain
MNQIKSKENSVLNAHMETLATAAVMMHNDVIANADSFWDKLKRKYYITPTSYLELLKIYLNEFIQQQTIIPFSIKRFNVGLTRMEETNKSVKILQAKIIEFQPILEKKAEQNEKLRIDLTEKNKSATAAEEVVSKEAEEIQSNVLTN